MVCTCRYRYRRRTRIGDGKPSKQSLGQSPGGRPSFDDLDTTLTCQRNRRSALTTIRSPPFEVRKFFSEVPFSRRDFLVASLASGPLPLSKGARSPISFSPARDHIALRWEDARQQFAYESALLQLMLGLSSADIRLRGHVNLVSIRKLSTLHVG